MPRRFGMSNQSKSKKDKSLAVKVILCCIVFVVLIIGGWEARRLFPYPTFLARLNIENWQVWEFHDYFGLNPETLSIVLGDRRLASLDDPPIWINEEVFFPALFVREYIDPFMFWDEGAQTLFVSTDTEVIGFTGEDVLKQGKPMVSLTFLQDTYPSFSIEYRKEYNTIIITNLEKPVGIATVTAGRTSIRYRPDCTAFITRHAQRGTVLTIFNLDLDAEMEYIRVRTEEGLLGYVLKADINFVAPEVYMPTLPLHFPKINLSWEMITAPAANIHAMNNPLPEGLNVISPTWFNFDPVSLNGEIISFASLDYVEWAHSQGVSVWAKVFDTNHSISHAILTNYQARKTAITQLVQFVKNYNLDGININFEHIRYADGGYYVQFLRELAPKMRQLGATLSVATFVPAPWFTQYHHELVGRTVDFVAIMTYDEHYAGSPEPGPVASLPFVERFIQETLMLIPREKVLMGLPFYNRLWRVTSDGNHTIRNYGMSRPWALVEEWGVVPVWDSTAGSYYVNFTTLEEDPVTYRIWIECERSIEAKLRIFTEYNLAGVAGWRRGLETEGVWERIRQAMS